MGKLFGTIKKEYHLECEKDEIIQHLPNAIEGIEEITGFIDRNKIIRITSKSRRHRLDKYSHDFFAQGVMKEKNGHTNIHFRIGTYWVYGLSIIAMFLLLLAMTIIIIWDNQTPFLSRRGEFVEEGIFIVFLFWIIGARHVYMIRKLAQHSIERLMNRMNEILST